jgi:hypothetical protein
MDLGLQKKCVHKQSYNLLPRLRKLGTTPSLSTTDVLRRLVSFVGGVLGDHGVSLSATCPP